MGKVAKRKQELLEVTTTCINCEAHLALDQRFCSKCGGKRMYNRLTWRNLLEDFAVLFLNVENSFFKTFIGLIKQPEDVIEGYMKGMRKKYLPAFSYFALALTVAGVYNFVLRTWFYDNYVTAQTSFYTGEAAELHQSFATSFSDTFIEYQSLFMFLFIPLMAILSRIVFWNYKKFNFVEHFVIFLYAYSQFSIVTSTIGMLFLWSVPTMQVLSFIITIGMFIYMGYVLKRVFNLEAENMVLKTGLFILILGGLFVGTTVATGIYFGIQKIRGVKSESSFGKMMDASIDHGVKSGIESKSKDFVVDSIEPVQKKSKDSISK